MRKWWRDRPHPWLRWFLFELKFFLFLLLCYLVHVTLMPYVRIFGITPNLLMAVMAVLIVGMDRWRGVWIGLIFGIILEVMQPTQSLFNLLLYPIAAIFGALLFYTKDEERLEYERSIGRSGRNTSPWLRTPACAATHMLIYSTLNLLFIYLRSGDLPLSFILKALLNLVLTSLLAALLMFPVRRFFRIEDPVDPADVKRPVPYVR